MGTLRTIALLIVGISFMTFITFFGRLPIFRNTPISFLHRLLWIHLPSALAAIDQRLTSGLVTRSTTRTFNYLMYDRHPTILIFFFLLLSVSEYYYLPAAWPHFTLFHKLAGSLAVILPYIFLYLAAFTDPGFVTPATHVRSMAQYPYDFTLFHPGLHCDTCRLLKPARSKHCSVCKRCVGRMDHHCIFINNCVGQRNQRHFLLLLLTTAILTLYGGILGHGIIADCIRTRHPAWTLFSPLWPGDRGGMPLRAWLAAWSWGLRTSGSVGLGAVTMLTLLITPLVWGLLAYHLWLIYCGTTTNESMKWADWQVDMDDAVVFRRKMPADRTKDLRFEPVWTRWPVEAEQVVVRTDDGKPPRGDSLPGVGEWEPVWKLRDVENLYDLGFWDNLLDVMRPGHEFRGQDVPVAETGGRNRRMKGGKTVGVDGTEGTEGTEE